jgi:hypothetical protein
VKSVGFPGVDGRRVDDRRQVLDQRAVARLALAQRLLGATALADVADVDHVRRAGRVVGARAAHRLEIHPVPVRVPEAELDAVRDARPGRQPGQPRRDALGVVGVEERGERGVLVFVRIVAEDAAHGRAAVARDARVVHDDDQVVRVLDHAPEARLALAQRRRALRHALLQPLVRGAQLALDAPQLRDVLRRADHALQRAGRVVRHLAARVQHAHLAVGAHDAVARLGAPAGAHPLLGERHHHRPVRGVHEGDEVVEGARVRRRVQPVDAQLLGRPGDAVLRDVPFEVAERRQRLHGLDVALALRQPAAQLRGLVAVRRGAGQAREGIGQRPLGLAPRRRVGRRDEAQRPRTAGAGERHVVRAVAWCDRLVDGEHLHGAAEGARGGVGEERERGRRGGGGRRHGESSGGAQQWGGTRKLRPRALSARCPRAPTARGAARASAAPRRRRRAPAAVPRSHRRAAPRRVRRARP